MIIELLVLNLDLDFNAFEIGGRNNNSNNVWVPHPSLLRELPLKGNPFM